MNIPKSESIYCNVLVARIAARSAYPVDIPALTMLCKCRRLQINNKGVARGLAVYLLFLLACHS